MKAFQNFAEKMLMPIAGKLATNKHLTAMKDSFVYAMPFIIVGSIVLLLVNLPIANEWINEAQGLKNPMYSQWYKDFMGAHKAKMVQPFYVSMGIMSLYVAFGLGYSLSNQYGLNGITGGFLSLFTFLITSAKLEWIPIAGYTDPAQAWNNEYVMGVFLKDGGWMPVMDARYLDAKGLFTAIIGGFLAIEIYKFMVGNKMTIKLPDAVPPAIARSFELLTPIVAVILIFQPLKQWFRLSLKMDIPDAILAAFKPLVAASDTLPAVIGILILVHVLWFAGLHGVNVVVAIINPIILTNLATNQSIIAKHGVDALRQASVMIEGKEVFPSIFAGGFLDAFVYLGGSGATIGLAVAMAMSKSDHLKSIGRLSIPAGIFNINEPIIFGAPIVMNPILFLPFLAVPIINATIAWFALKAGIVGKIVTLVPWTTPGPIAAYIATNMSLQGLILSVIGVVVSFVVYWPFVKVYEKELAKEEAAA